MITFEQAKQAFPGGKMDGREYVTECPFRARHKKRPNNKLCITEQNGELCLNCFSCAEHPDRDVWAELQRRVYGESNSTSPAVQKMDDDWGPPRPWPKQLPLFPGGWQPFTRATRDAIAAKRKDYTPLVETMRDSGVMEAKGQLVCFPCRVGEEVRNLRVLDFTKPKNDWEFKQYREGPERKWIQADGGVLFSPQPLELLDPFKPLFIVEGQWDAMALCEHGFQAVSLSCAHQKTIADDVLKYLDGANAIYFAYDNDSGTGWKAVQHLAPLLPQERTFLFPWADWDVKDACELRSKCETGEQFKEEICALIDRIEDSEAERREQPELADYYDKLELWDGVSPMPTATTTNTDVLDMPEDVLDTRLGEICRTRMPADLPRAYAWLALVTAAANLVTECPDLRANLYSCLVGELGTGKSTAIDYACALLGLDEKIRKEILAGSAEKLIRQLKDSEGAPRLLDVDELGHLLAKSQIDRASFPYILSMAYYKTKFTAGTGDGIFLFDCRLSVIGGVVESNFPNVYGASTVYGLHDRTLFGLVQKADKYLRRPIDLSPALQAQAVAVQIDSSVWDERDRWIREHPDWNPRVAETCLRVALICASIDGRTVLHARDLGPAKALCAYQHRVRLLLKPSVGENPDARCAETILRWFNTHPGQAIRRRELSRKINANRFGPSVFNRSVTSLLALEELAETKGVLRLDDRR